MINPVFIIGAPRSGTTLVQCILSANSHTFSLPETHFFTILRNLGRSANDHLTVTDLNNISRIIASKSGICIPQSIYQDLCEQAEKQTLLAVSLFETIVELYRPKDDAYKQLLVVEKTPSHFSSLFQISETYPTAKFINVVRNPLDVINSLSKPPFASTSFVVARARLWNHALDCVHQFQEYSPERLLSIRYEDIVTDAERPTC